MIFNQHLLFIHVPKTGGTSATQYLLDVLPKPVYYTHRPHDRRMSGDGVVRLPGRTHESLAEARDVVRGHGFDLDRFPAILAVLRNPYSLKVSLYTYFQSRDLPNASSQEHIRIARTSDFAAFVRRKQRTTIHRFFETDGRIPDNMRIIKYEGMVDGIKNELRRLGIPPDRDFPWRNSSFHLDFVRYYDAAIEEAVYNRYRWVFDHGFYDRLAPDLLVGGGDPPPSHLLPVDGPVQEPERRIGSLSGFWPDGWIGEKLAFEIVVERDIKAICLNGTIPREVGDRTQLLLTVNRRRHRSAFGSGQPFSWRVPCHLPAGATARVEVESSATWSPSDGQDSRDRRRLSFRLHGIAFEETDPATATRSSGRALVRAMASVLRRTGGP